MIDYSKLTDSELASLLKNGDQYAYTQIFERYNELLLRHAYRLLENRSEAGDIVQDIFLIIWQKRESIVFKTALSAYLYRSVRNHIFDLISHQKVVARYAESIGTFMEQGYTLIDDRIREKELAGIIEKEIAALPPKMREVFLLSRQEEYSYQEIAGQLNITHRTAKQQVYNAVKTLKLKLDPFLGVFMFL